MSERILLVPMSLDALVMSEEQRMANMAPTFDHLLDDTTIKLGSSVRPKPWDYATNIDMEAGVHLHWALPAALRNGKQTQSGEIQFPPAPNRWLVLRISGDPKLTKAWVLQSDYVGERDDDGDPHRQNSSCILAPRNGRYAVYQIGRRFKYEEQGWETKLDEDHTWRPLTAVTPGNPGFAAFYPGCRNVFAFHDELDGVDAGTFSYLVAGWYETLGDDPICSDETGAKDGIDWTAHFRKSWLEPNLTWDQDAKRCWWRDPNPDATKYEVPNLKWDEAAKRWRWEDPNQSGTKYDVPNRTLCHGALYGITWPKEASITSTERYVVAVANTATEALSTFISHELNSQRFESLLSAFQYGMLGSMEKLHGMLELDEEIHRRAFEPVEGSGTRWVLRLIPHSVSATSGKQQQRPPSFPDNPDIALWFDQLCDKQAEYDQLARQRIALGEQYFALWYQRQRDELKKKSERSQELKPGSKLETDLQAAIQRTDLMLHGDSKLQGTQDLIKAIREYITEALKPTGKGDPAYELVATPMPCFWRPTDPAILVASSAGPRRHRYASSSGGPKCRIVESLISKLSWKDNFWIDSQEIKEIAKLPFEKRTGSNMPFEAIAGLYYEALLLDADRIEWLATPKCDKNRSLGSKADALDALNKDAGMKLGTMDGIAKLEPGWDPLFMVWKLEWSPVYSDPGEWNKCGRTLGDSSDYEPVMGVGPAANEKHVCYGWAPLSISLGERLERLIKLAEIEKDGAIPAKLFRDWDFVSQSANGLTSMLLLREETLQLPPLDKDSKLLNTVQDLVGSAPRWSPLVRASSEPLAPAFSPIRAGQFRLSQLLLVDGFGRIKKLVDDTDNKPLPLLSQDEKICLGESFGGDTRELQDWITPPPRIAQAARLKCSWISVADECHGKGYKESNSNPATGPILGWIIPNYFDRSLVICDRKGILRGELRALAGQKPEVQLSPLPGCVLSAGGDAFLEDADCFQLRDFVKGICSRGPSALEACLTLMGKLSMCIPTPAAQQTQTMDLVLGQPLALARASLSLQVWGKLAANPPWAEPSPSRIRFPVRIGDARKGDDGLIGYFISDVPGNGYDYSKMRLPYGAPLQSRPEYFAPNSYAEVGLGEVSLKLTLLMDPRAGVHIVSGILPSQFLELPENAVTEPLANIELSFRAGPVLAVDGVLRLPLPADVAGDWRWFNRDLKKGAGWQVQPDVAKAPSAPALPSQRVEVYDGWLSHSKRE